MGQRKTVKLEDIAKKVGVSIVTVSNALNGKKGVGKVLCEDIQKTAEEMGYFSSERDRKKKRSTYIIGVVVAERYVKEFPSFYMDIYKRIAQEAVKKGNLTVLEIVSPEKENLKIDFAPFLEGEMAGLILIGELKKEYIEAIRMSYQIPIVCVDYYDVYADMDYIITDGFDPLEIGSSDLVICRIILNLEYIVKTCDIGNIIPIKIQFTIIYIAIRHCEGGGCIVIYIVRIDFVDGHGADRLTPGQNGSQLRGSGITARQHEILYAVGRGETIN